MLVPSLWWLALNSLLPLSLVSFASFAAAQEVDEIETISQRGQDGLELVELAFRPPMAGVPQHALDVFCASTKMRLYWGVFREEIKETHRKGFHLRHAARMAKHVFSDVRDADKPFNATMLSQIDKWFPVKFDNPALEGGASESESETEAKPAASVGGKIAAVSKKTICDLKSKLKRQKSCAGIEDGASKSAKKDSKSTANEPPAAGGDGNESNNSETTSDQESLDLLDSSEPNQVDDIDTNKFTEIKKQLKGFLKKWSPKVAMSLYTRWRTLWWLMMSCLFTKYYLWDPALDEFTKLKRNLVMWPELQLVKLKDLQCKPVQLFRRMLDACKILNPLLNINFGQLSLEKPTRFKGDIN